jgi:protein gp37
MSTGIEWTGETWNFVTGCTPLPAVTGAPGSGCDHCYAHTLALGKLAAVYGARLPVVDTAANRADTFAARLWPERLTKPASWKAPRMIFVNSMSDLFHIDVPDEFVAAGFRVMLENDRHIYQVLTKRPGRLLRWFRKHREMFPGGRVPEHIWLGTTVESAAVASRCLPLLRVDAAVTFLSCEPLLDDVADALAPYLWGACVLTREHHDEHCAGGEFCDERAVSWVICGGESGAGYRPMDVRHAQSLRDACSEAGVPFFFKQVGGRTPKAGGRLLDGREWNDFPALAHPLTNRR